MRILLSKTYKKGLDDLPQHVQEKADKQLKLLSQDIQHSSLETKKLKGKDNFYSVRVGRDYRILFSFYSEDALYILDTDHRKDVYR